MGSLVNGAWQQTPLKDNDEKGEFLRPQAVFDHWVTPGGEAGPTGEGGFPASAGRYHLYISLACPWACRALLVYTLKELDDVIGLTVTDPLMLENGWEYKDPEPIYGYRFHHQLYTHADPTYTGKVTVPVLWDKQKETIVNNESSLIVRILNSAFDEFTSVKLDLCPEEHGSEIDEVNSRVYENVNNGVYRAGFATTQRAYERAFDSLFATLDELELRLQDQRYLVANRFTEADVRLFTTLARFDAVYYQHFKCNRLRIADYPNLQAYLKDIYQIPGAASTVDYHHIKQHYFRSHPEINPTRIVPKGPLLDLSSAHGRERLGPEALD